MTFEIFCLQNYAGWYEKTPSDFIFAAKVITHEKILVNCEAEFEDFKVAGGGGGIQLSLA